MKKFEITNKVSRSFNKIGFGLKKHSPEILVVAGVVGTVTSAVMACKATLKLDEVLAEPKSTIAKIHETAEKGLDNYTEKDAKNDLRIVYTKSAVSLAKLYGPAVILGAVSITSIFTGHNILRKRNLALAAAYTVVDKGFKEYRGRVVERFGKDLDQELRHNIKAKEIETIAYDENGEETITKEIVPVINPNEVSDYARLWYEGSKGWSKDPEYNLQFLKLQQSYANDKLQSRGYLYLNEVYELLGFKTTKAGHVVGWVFDKENPVGDNFVDFGIYASPEFVNGDERGILLDFNVDGNIYELMY